METGKADSTVIIQLADTRSFHKIINFMDKLYMRDLL